MSANGAPLLFPPKKDATMTDVPTTPEPAGEAPVETTPPVVPSPYETPLAAHPGPPPAPAYAPPPPPPGYASAPYPGTTPRTNGFAIAALILGILGPVFCIIPAILALVFGYQAKSQIRDSHGTQEGSGIATAGIILGWMWVGLAVLYIVLLIILSATGNSN